MMTRRPRRLRRNALIRDLVHETDINLNDLVFPIFVIDGENIKEEIPSMPGIYRYSLDRLPEHLSEIEESGVKAVIFFGIPEHKDECGSEAYSDDGIVQKALRLARKQCPDMLLIADICLCEYTSHGHCGILSKDGAVMNDPTLTYLAKTALAAAKAGADIVAPSDMMDGRVGAIREMLDENGFEDTIIMAYSVKYASSYYGPFRDAADSAPAFGDRRSYQMDWRNKNEALLECDLDTEEGADILMVKPALSYLDIIKTVSENTVLPLCAYSVSGEYSMMKAAALNGWIDEKKLVMETMTAIKRAGAKIIITYYALDIARWLKEM